MPFTTEQVPVPASAEAPWPPQIRDLVAVERAHHRRLYGREDLVHDERAVTVGLLCQERTARARLVTRNGSGRAVGAAHLLLPRGEGADRGLFFPSWDPGSGTDEAEVYDALWATAQEVLTAAARTSVQCWAMHPAPADPADATWLTPVTGAGRVAQDVRARWLAAQGFVLEQVELYSVLDVAEMLPEETRPAAGDRERSCGADPAAGAAYRLRSWTGATPPELLPGMARLYSRMSVDAPSGGLDADEDEWDEAAVATQDERAATMGTVRLTTVALDGDGAPVAYTVIDHEPDQPLAASQDDTLVHGDHRGHGLGLLVKTANLRQLREQLPAVERVHTWNAAENTHMLAVNRALGFHETGAQGGWQVRLAPGRR